MMQHPHLPVCFNNNNNTTTSTSTSTATIAAELRSSGNRTNNNVQVTTTRSSRSPSQPVVGIPTTLLQPVTSFPSLPFTTNSFPRPLRRARSRADANIEAIRIIDHALDIINGVDDDENEQHQASEIIQ